MKLRKFEGEPPPPRKKGGKWKYPLPEMEVKDCFDVPDANVSSVRASANAYSKKSGKKFSVRETVDGFVCIRVS